MAHWLRSAAIKLRNVPGRYYSTWVKVNATRRYLGFIRNPGIAKATKSSGTTKDKKRRGTIHGGKTHTMHASLSYSSVQQSSLVLSCLSLSARNNSPAGRCRRGPRGPSPSARASWAPARAPLHSPRRRTGRRWRLPPPRSKRCGGSWLGPSATPGWSRLRED